MESFRRMMPALFTRISIPPETSSASAITGSSAAIWPRSARMAWKGAPVGATSASVSSIPERPTATIPAPAPASATARPWPMPVFAPVTTAQRPVRSKAEGIFRVSCGSGEGVLAWAGWRAAHRMARSDIRMMNFSQDI